MISVSLTRARIAIHAIDSSLNRSSDGTQVGYIRLKQFNANSARDMRDAIRRFEKDGVDGYVLDLRFNPGGLLEASVDIARQWLNKGTIVSTRTREDSRRASCHR